MPSEKVLEAKKAQVAEIIEVLKNATTGILVDYRGLNVEEDTKLRNDLRAAGVKYFVIYSYGVTRQTYHIFRPQRVRQDHNSEAALGGVSSI